MKTKFRKWAKDNYGGNALLRIIDSDIETFAVAFAEHIIKNPTKNKKQ